MGRLRFFLFLLSVGMGLNLAAVSALACTCLGAYDAKTMRDTAIWYSGGSNASKIVFEGAVEKQELKTGSMGAPGNAMSMTTSGAHRAVYMRVLRSYRGQVSDTVIVLTGMGDADCGFDFETGNQYLVYADRIDAGHLFTSICAGTSPSERAGPALRYLRGEKPTPDDLIDIKSYYAKFGPQWTGTACGRVTMPDGSPFAEGSIEMTQIRDEPFPPKSADDPNLSTPDGSFCVEYIAPGKYVLTAEAVDYKTDSRWMGYYPGVAKHSEAVPIEVHAGDRLSKLDFTVWKQPVYTVSFHISTIDGSPPPLGRLGVSIQSPDRDALAYQLTQNRQKDGYYTVGYVPPGIYTVRTYLMPDLSEGEAPAQPFDWQMLDLQVEIKGDTTVELKMRRVN